ncbi:MAG: response regulator [Methylococcaceae bacterium]|nr:response regulator [Methylococcaceae bacterium]
MIKVLLVDDHDLIASGIKLMLDLVDNINVIGVVNSGEDAIVAVEKNQPDVILMDVKMPGIGGTEASKRILEVHPDIKIIGLSQHDSNAVTKQFINLGAVGFVSKSSSSEEMMDSIQNAMGGGTYLSLDVKERMASKKGNNPFSTLSSRESEVVELIVQGKSIKEMSEIMRIKDKTVNTFRYRVYKKLGVKNDVELIRLIDKFNNT